MKKKVLILTTALDIGGITSFMLPIVNLLKSEYDLTIAYTTDKYNKLSEITGDIELVQFEEPCKKKHSTVYVDAWVDEPYYQGQV